MTPALAVTNEFAVFVAAAEPRLRMALGSAYGFDLADFVQRGIELGEQRLSAVDHALHGGAHLAGLRHLPGDTLRPVDRFVDGIDSARHPVGHALGAAGGFDGLERGHPDSRCHVGLLQPIKVGAIALQGRNQVGLHRAGA